MLAAFILLTLFQRIESYLSFVILKMSKGDNPSDFDKTFADNIEILHDSSHFLIVNKSYDVIINHKDQTRQVTVQKQIERQYPELINPSLLLSFYFPHRLDYATSGILCIAKHKKACAAASKAFEGRKAIKFYIAIVRGWISQDFLTISEPIGLDTLNSFRMATKSSPFCSKLSRDATTNLVVLEKGICYGYPATKILMRPLTGRRHQLRLHCSSIGHTIVGDFTYSNRSDSKPHRMFLHALRLVLPTELERIDITSNDPFASNDLKNNWVPNESIYSIEDAIIYLEKERVAKCMK